MYSNLYVLAVSLQMSLLVVCLFSIIYLSYLNWKQNRWLVLIFFIHFWVTFNYMISSGGYGIVADTSYLLSVSPLLLFFPALYFYTQDLVQPNNISLVQRLPHFIPFLILYVMGVIVGKEAPMDTLKQAPNSYFMMIFTGVNLVVTLGYSYYIFQLVQFNQRKYQNEYASNNASVSLTWIIWMVGFLVIMPLLGLCSQLFFTESELEVKVLVVVISMLLAMLILAFFTFRQPTLYREEELEIEIQEAIQTGHQLAKENIKFTIPDDEKAIYIAKIETHFMETKPYLDPKIRMPELARTLDIPRHIFSSIINEHYRMNFFNLINQYRVEHAKTLLKDKKNQFYTLETIGEMAGFNSRSTFNKRFKEFTGMSPKEYQQGPTV